MGPGHNSAVVCSGSLTQVSVWGEWQIASYFAAQGCVKLAISTKLGRDVLPKRPRLGWNGRFGETSYHAQALHIELDAALFAAPQITAAAGSRMQHPC